MGTLTYFLVAFIIVIGGLRFLALALRATANVLERFADWFHAKVEAIREKSEP